MNKKPVYFLILCLCILSFTMTGCMSTGSNAAKTPPTGSAGGSNAQNADSGLGTGGNLGVRDSQQAVATPTIIEGVMTERNYNSATRQYDYVVLTKDRVRTFTFSSTKKITYKNDLIRFSAPGGQIDEQSIKLLERKYLQKYWQ